jgi:hypothetical protein
LTLLACPQCTVGFLPNFKMNEHGVERSKFSELHIYVSV